MLQDKLKLFCMVICLLIAFLSNAFCQIGDEDWNSCVALNTITSYRAFLDKYQSSSHVREAELKLSTFVSKNKVDIDNTSILPARSDHRISCTLYEFKPSGVYTQKFSLGTPSNATKVSIYGLSPERKIGKCLFDSEGDVLIQDGQFKAKVAYSGDLISKAPGYVGIDNNGAAALNTTGGSISGYWDISGGSKNFQSFSDWILNKLPQLRESWWLCLENNILRFSGSIRFLNLVFNGDSESPLCFLVTKNGFIYLHGRGTVTEPNGTSLTFPNN